MDAPLRTDAPLAAGAAPPPVEASPATDAPPGIGGPPPPEVAPPDPGRRGKGRGRRALLLLAISVAAAGVAGRLAYRGWRHFRVDRGPSRFDVADRFVEALRVGDGVTPSGAGGYQAAYDLLSSERRERVSFDAFYEEWVRRADVEGFIEKHEWIGRGAPSAVRNERQSFEIVTAGAPGDGGAPRVYRLDVRVVPEGSGFRIGSYACGPRAPRPAK
ncbi:MAG TPA: hypothetical protein VEI02_03585 [Planctomycetota bacterium]|nr:hypothetical protein [Planctomycetota bacterium]